MSSASRKREAERAQAILKKQPDWAKSQIEKLPPVSAPRSVQVEVSPPKNVIVGLFTALFSPKMRSQRARLAEYDRRMAPKFEVVARPREGETKPEPAPETHEP